MVASKGKGVKQQRAMPLKKFLARQPGGASKALRDLYEKNVTARSPVGKASLDVKVTAEIHKLAAAQGVVLKRFSRTTLGSYRTEVGIKKYSSKKTRASKTHKFEANVDMVVVMVGQVSVPLPDEYKATAVELVAGNKGGYAILRLSIERLPAK